MNVLITPNKLGPCFPTLALSPRMPPVSALSLETRDCYLEETRESERFNAVPEIGTPHEDTDCRPVCVNSYYVMMGLPSVVLLHLRGRGSGTSMQGDKS